MDKKAALELSVNAIVILILAITMLGLGLGFVRGMFGKTSGQFEELIGAEQEPPTPTGSNPITLSRENVITQANKKVVLKVGFFNPTNAAAGVTTGGDIIGCGVTGETFNTVSVNPQESKVFSVMFDPPASGFNLCKITVGSYTKDFTIKVTS